MSNFPGGGKQAACRFSRAVIPFSPAARPIRRRFREDVAMIIPCIDLMDGKVVQLIQGREKALEGEQPLVMLDKFSAFPEIQVIDLDAALGKGSNDAIVRELAARAVTRVGGGVRSLDKARTLLDGGASKVIVGTAAFSGNGINKEFLTELIAGVRRDRIILALDSKGPASGQSRS